jgi:hypothetical protein
MHARRGQMHGGDWGGYILEGGDTLVVNAAPLTVAIGW